MRRELTALMVKHDANLVINGNCLLVEVLLRLDVGLATAYSSLAPAISSWALASSRPMATRS
jgi:hypothetical protein